MTEEKLKRVTLWQKETHKLIDEEKEKFSPIDPSKFNATESGQVVKEPVYKEQIMFKAKTITRTSRRVDEGTMGFKDWVTYHEKPEDFANRVMEEANKIQNVKGIQFAENYAVIIYKE